MSDAPPLHKKLPFTSVPADDRFQLPPRTHFRCQCGYEVIAPDIAEGAAAMDEHLAPGIGWATRAWLADDPE